FMATSRRKENREYLEGISFRPWRTGSSARGFFSAPPEGIEFLLCGVRFCCSNRQDRPAADEELAAQATSAEALGNRPGEVLRYFYVVFPLNNLYLCAAVARGAAVTHALATCSPSSRLRTGVRFFVNSRHCWTSQQWHPNF